MTDKKKKKHITKIETDETVNKRKLYKGRHDRKHNISQERMLEWKSQDGGYMRRSTGRGERRVRTEKITTLENKKLRSN